MYPIFIANKNSYNLFSKNHSISTFGAKIIGCTIADYIKQTTYGLEQNFQLLREPSLIYTSDYGKPELLSEECDTFYVKTNSRKVRYWNQHTESSKIAIFGDCNLQSYSSDGAGISANLSYFLQYPVYNAGRILIFGFEEKPLQFEELMNLCKYDIVIYVAFASAPFVRTATLFLRRPKLEYKWQHLKLIEGGRIQ